MLIRSILNWALLFAVPFLFLWNVNADPIRFAKIGGVVILGAAALGAYLWERVKPSLGVAAFYVLFNMAVTGFGAAQELVSICVVCSIMVGLVYRGATQSLLKQGLIALSLMATAQALWCFVQVNGLDPVFIYTNENDRNMPVAFFGQQTLLGPILAVGMIASLTLGGRFLICALIIAPIIVMAGSSFTYLSVVAGVGYLAVKRVKPKVVFAAVAFGLIALPLIYLIDSEIFNDNGRFKLWSQIFYIYTNKFTAWQQAIGLGGGSFKPVYLGFVKSAYELKATGQIGWLSKSMIELHQMCGEFHQAHNDYIQVLFEFGCIGVMIMVWMLSDVVDALKETRCNVVVGYGAILLALLANSLGNFTMRLQPHGVIALICFIVVVTQERRLVE